MTPPVVPAAATAAHGATVTLRVRLTGTGRGRKRLTRPDPAVAAPPPLGRVPRVARMMALAIHWQRLIRIGVAEDQAALARLVGISRARVTQVMDLLRLAPDIQEAILGLPRIEHGCDPVHGRDLCCIAAQPLWVEQRAAWRTNYS